MTKGDIILIPFPFTDLSGNKLRPAVVLIAGQIDLTVCFITTQSKWQEPTDIQIKPSSSTGIKKDSVIRVSKIATIDKTLALGLLGNLDNQLLADINKNLKQLFQLP